MAVSVWQHERFHIFGVTNSISLVPKPHSKKELNPLHTSLPTNSLSYFLQGYSSVSIS
jgi:hypothetical protein